MVVEESAPGLRGWLAWPGRHEAGDAALADVDAELEQLAVDPWRAPAYVGLGHLENERLDSGRDVVLSGGTGTRLPAPEKAESSAVPADDGVWLDDDQHIRPARPQAGESEPEGPVNPSQAWASGGAPEVGELLAKSEVFECEVSSGAKGRAEG